MFIQGFLWNLYFLAFSGGWFIIYIKDVSFRMCLLSVILCDELTQWTTVLCIIPWIILIVCFVCSSSTRCSDAYSDTMLGYANSIRTIDGGTHIEGVKASLTRTLNNLGKKLKIIKVFLFIPTNLDYLSSLFQGKIYEDCVYFERFSCSWLKYFKKLSS